MSTEEERDITSLDDSDALKRMTEIYKSRYFGVENLKEIGKPVTAKIVKVATERLKACRLGGKKLEGGEKGVITIESASGRKYEILLNKTSWGNLKHAWGIDKEKWVGGSVVIELKPVNGKDATVVSPA